MNKDRINKNKELVSKYPFLAFKSYDFDNDVYYIPEDYDYYSTWLDGLPEGWVEAFGEQMCEELKEALDEYNYTDKYIVIETKEKYGSMRWYDSGIPKGCKAHDVINKYEKLSEVTCCKCGKPATKISMGWICPWCDECAKEINGRFYEIKENDDNDNAE